MKLLIFGVVLLLALAAATARAASGLLAALPPDSRVLASAQIASSGAEAVAFSTGDAYIGVVAGSPAAPQLIWKQRLPYLVDQLSVRVNSNVFQGTGRDPSNLGAEFFAYRVSGGSVRSAIGGHPHGIVMAAEGLSLADGAFTVRRAETTHIGKVKYAQLTTYDLRASVFEPVRTILRPDYSSSKLPHPSASDSTYNGDTILIELEVAATDQERQTGLMNRHSLDPDAGMIFVWPAEVQESFWMENTYIPLTVAFLSPTGVIEEMQDMQPETRVLHTPGAAYEFAIEANQGFFAKNGIRVGDRMKLDLRPNS